MLLGSGFTSQGLIVPPRLRAVLLRVVPVPLRVPVDVVPLVVALGRRRRPGPEEEGREEPPGAREEAEVQQPGSPQAPAARGDGDDRRTDEQERVPRRSDPPTHPRTRRGTRDLAPRADRAGRDHKLNTSDLFIPFVNLG